MTEPRHLRPMSPAEVHQEEELRRIGRFLGERFLKPILAFAEASGWDVIEKITFTFHTKDGLEHSVSESCVRVEALKRSLEMLAEGE